MDDNNHGDDNHFRNYNADIDYENVDTQNCYNGSESNDGYIHNDTDCLIR